MLLASIGVLPGIAAAPGAEQLISFLLFGLAPYNVPTIAAATGVMVVVPAIAGFMPARSPSHVDPMVALHDE